jgi:hypothetical protein
MALKREKSPILQQICHLDRSVPGFPASQS